MYARTRVLPVAAVITALVLNASAAHGQATEPEVSVPTPAPEPGLKPAAPNSLRQLVDPDSPPAGAKPRGPFLSEPEMVHEPRWGLIAGGLLIMGPGVIAGAIAWAAGNDCVFDEPCQLGIAGTAFLGTIEAVGLTVLIVGIVGNDVPAPPAAQGTNLSFLPFVTPRAEGLSMSIRW
jgi:hypothetical protein